MTLPVYNCLIVDDEPPAREVLKRYIAKMPILRLVGELGNAFQVTTFLHENPVDIIFLDIRMPQLNGLDLIRTLSHPPRIIFTTAFAEHALESYELDATDYLLKPIKFERFIKAVNKALPKTTAAQASALLTPVSKPNPQQAENFLYFRADRKMVKVMLENIVYIESLKDYVKIITTSRTVITKNSLTVLEAMLPSADFLRIHRSFIISISKITSYTNTSVHLADNELPIGKLYSREVFAVLRSA